MFRFSRLLLFVLLLQGVALVANAQSGKRKPLVVFVCGDHEYSGEQTLPLIAQELERRYGMQTRVLTAFPDQNAEENIPGLEILKGADLAVFFMRWRRLPAEQVAHIESYLNSRKPVVGFRTSTHAFNYPQGHTLEKWNAFGKFAFGAPPGWGGGHYHYGHDSSTDVAVIPAAAKHPILTGVAPSFHVRSWLYHVLPDYPPAGATRLLMGKAVNPDKIATENPVAWAGRNQAGGRVFMTTLGHPEDFSVEAVQRLVINGIHWAVGKPVPKTWAGKLSISVPYRGIQPSSPAPKEKAVNHDAILREIQDLKQRVAALEETNRSLKQLLEVERLVVKKELIVSDTGLPWEKGYDAHQIPRGIYARSLWDGPGGLWVRSRLIKGEVDDPFDDRFHALERNGSFRRSPGHISWNVWLDGAWRQMAIIQGEGVELSELPLEKWNGGSHPGRIRFQTFRPQHSEPLTDALIGQGMMSLGGGGYGGGGLPAPTDVLQIWGGSLLQVPLSSPAVPLIVQDDGSGVHEYAVIAIAAQGRRSGVSHSVKARGRAKLRWDSVPGADAYIVVRDGKEITTPLRIEGAQKEWTDTSPLPK
jgi:type 1 glutamine amidotransferase